MKLRGYLTSRPFMGERVPQRVQNIVMRDYCEKNGFSYLLGAVEYSFEGSTHILDSLIDNIESVDGLVFYSMFQLPENEFKRIAAIRKLVSNSKQLHFSLEGLVINKLLDYEKAESIWRIKSALDEYPKQIIQQELKRFIEFET